MFRKVSLIFFSALILSGCLQTPPIPESESEPPADSEPEAKKPLVIDQITQDWQEYQNDQYGFAIKFPADWQVNQTYPNPNIAPLVVYSTIPEDQRDSTPYAIFTVSIEAAKDRNLTSYNVIGNHVMDGYNKSSLEIANTQAVLLVTSDDNKDLANIIILRDGYFYRLTWNATTRATRAQYEDIFKQIVATFKFTHRPNQEQKWI